jgi:hypothetical protein
MRALAACSFAWLVCAPASAQDAGVSADACGEAAFAAAEAQAAGFDSLTIALPSPLLHPDALRLQAVRDTLMAASSRAEAIVNAYVAVLRCRSPRWTVAAYERQGHVYEVLAHAIVVARQHASDERVGHVLDARIVPIECLAVVRYLLAVRAARPLASSPAGARLAFERLRAYGDYRVTVCATDQHERDPAFMSFVPASDFAPLP